jgi:hypothetical protein
MNAYSWLTLIAIVLGPVVAVAITLVTESVRRARERRIQIMRMLLATRHLPADPQYNMAINLIPAEFNDQKEVMDEWRKYHALVRQPFDEQTKADHLKRLTVAQSALIFQVMRCVGLRLSEGDIQTEVYISQGFVDRDALYIASLQAMPEIAKTLDEQRKLTQIIVDAIPRRDQPGSTSLTPNPESGVHS